MDKLQHLMASPIWLGVCATLCPWSCCSNIITLFNILFRNHKSVRLDSDIPIIIPLLPELVGVSLNVLEPHPVWTRPCPGNSPQTGVLSTQALTLVSIVLPEAILERPPVYLWGKEAFLIGQVFVKCFVIIHLESSGRDITYLPGFLTRVPHQGWCLAFSLGSPTSSARASTPQW